MTRKEPGLFKDDDWVVNDFSTSIRLPLPSPPLLKRRQKKVAQEVRSCVEFDPLQKQKKGAGHLRHHLSQHNHPLFTSFSWPRPSRRKAIVKPYLLLLHDLLYYDGGGGGGGGGQGIVACQGGEARRGGDGGVLAHVVGVEELGGGVEGEEGNAMASRGLEQKQRREKKKGWETKPVTFSFL